MSRGWMVALLAMMAIAALTLTPFCGPERIPYRALWGDVPDEALVNILWHMRIPRVVLAFLAGTALATSGMAFQAVFRNPLATPFTLGISSGASLGAVVAIHAGWTFSVLGVSSVSMSACAAALFSLILIHLFVAAARRGVSTAAMILAGMALTVFFSSLIVCFRFPSEIFFHQRMLRWVVGGLESVVGGHDLLSVLPFVVSGCLIVWYFTLELNLLTMGSEFAFVRGVGVEMTKLSLLFAAVLMVGGVAGACGPIGFVGLIVPHYARLIVGPDHRWLYPASWLFGGAFLVFLDTVARCISGSADLPVGILTAMLGGPFFIVVLMRRRHDLGDVRWTKDE